MTQMSVITAWIVSKKAVNMAKISSKVKFFSELIVVARYAVACGRMNNQEVLLYESINGVTRGKNVSSIF